MKTDFTIVAVIPARRGSTRLPEKPLKLINGKTLIQRVWEQSSKCSSINKLLIATDDAEIKNLGESFGAKVFMTSPDIPSGSARVGAAVKMLNTDWDIAINIQGDMPFIDESVIDLAINYFKANFDKYSMVTIAIPIIDKEEFYKPTSVKVVVSDEGRALYFSRAPIPHSRDGDSWELNRTNQEFYGLKHIGLYLFKKEALLELEDNEVSSLEKVEKLEQLKLLERGHSIGVCIVPRELMERSIEVDTEDDLKAAEIEAKARKSS
jgi:3-deoxy-manno-octulosonate cytidylyltransferase (CMP-KDO synthetase)